MAYCSTLAIYFMNLDNFSIHKIIAAHEQTISCITWNPHNVSHMASVSMDKHLYIWDVNSDLPVLDIQLPNPLLMMDWSPHNAEEILMLVDNGDVSVLNLATRTVKRIGNLIGVQPRLIRWHPQKVFPI